MAEHGVRKFRLFTAAALVAALLAGCAQTAPVAPVDGAASQVLLAPPVAEKKPYTVESPNGNRTDNYYWLRDDTRKSPEMLAYLDAENAYRDQQLAHTAALQQKLYDEMVARLKPDDASVATLDHGYWYYTRFEKRQGISGLRASQG